MAAKTKRKADVQEKPAPLTDDQIVAGFRSKADAVISQFETAVGVFIARFTEEPTETLSWRGYGITVLETEAKVWRDAAAFLESAIGPESTLGRAIELETWSQERLDRMIRMRPWQHNSTSLMHNVATVGKATGEAEAWSEIRDYARSMAKTIRERDSASD